MTVLSVGYPLFPVAADASGGAEQILLLLERQLCASHDSSLVIAAEGSRVAGRLITTPVVAGQIGDEERTWAQRQHRRAIDRALAQNQIDLIHFHGLDFHHYMPETNIPMLVTLHLPLTWYPDDVLTNTPVRVNCVSRTQAADTHWPVVPNGVDTARFQLSSTKDPYLLWIGRICPEKGVHLALEIAHRVNLPMIVAGPVHPFADHQRYFTDRVQPLLDGTRHYVGAVSGRQKTTLLSRARALLVTSLAPETSSLVAMEALSSGTPVVALRTGALPEVVEHGLTGFIGDSVDELSSFITRLSSLSPAICRSRAVERFSASRMFRDYLSLYKQILETSSAPQDCLYGSSPLRKFHAV